MDANKDLYSKLENIEIKAFSDLYRAAKPNSIENCGIGLQSSGSTCVLIASKLDVLALNRVIGLGLKEPGSDNDIDDMISIFRKAGSSRFFVQIHPNARPQNIRDSLLMRGFSHHNNWVRLYRKATPLTKAETSLNIERIDSKHASEFAHIVTSCFGWPPLMRPWITEFIGRKNWHFYMAFDGEKPAATGAFFIEGEFAWISFASTLPEFRGRGAQSALAERRVRDMIDLGAKWISVETAEETADHAAPSFRNLTRLGFEVAYVRPNYIYKLEQKN